MNFELKSNSRTPQIGDGLRAWVGHTAALSLEAEPGLLLLMPAVSSFQTELFELEYPGVWATLIK